MIEMLDLAKWLHIVGATVLLGTGSGIAFFMVMAHRTKDAALIAHTASIVVVADWIFTSTAVVLQPLTGIWLTQLAGWSLTEGWIVISLVLFVVTGIFWLPVVWIQHQMRDLARTAAAHGTALPARYFRFFKIWFVSGIPAFAAVLAIIWLMITRPAFG